MSDSIQVNLDSETPTLLEQSKQRLRAFFQNPYVKKLTPILVPGALAAALLPIFGPVVAALRQRWRSRTRLPSSILK